VKVIDLTLRGAWGHLGQGSIESAMYLIETLGGVVAPMLLLSMRRVDRTCTSCHGSWSPENFQHAVTGLRLDEMHAQLDCSQCHKDRRYDADPTCSDCHDDGRTAAGAPPGEKIRHP
jgi:hypothetical protein